MSRPTISQQLNTIAGQLAGWAAQYAGTCDVASDMQQLWEWAMMQHDKVRCIVAFDSEIPRSDFQVAEAIARVDRTFAIAVTRGRGLLTTRGASVVSIDGTTTQFADLYEQARDAVRSILTINMDDGRIPYFKEARRMQIQDGTLLDGWIFFISVLAQLPFIAGTPTQTT